MGQKTIVKFDAQQFGDNKTVGDNQGKINRSDISLKPHQMPLKQKRTYWEAVSGWNALDHKPNRWSTLNCDCTTATKRT